MTQHPKTIKSFVKRAGRMTNRQQHALAELLPKYQVAFKEQQLDNEMTFANQHAVIVEIGFGMGQSLFECARDNPHQNYIGIEVHSAGVGALVADIHEAGLKNIKVINNDAVTIIKEQIMDNTIDGFQIFFPDPWHKKRHHKRRLIQVEFIQLLVNKLKPQGFLHIATDWQNYAEDILAVCNANTALANQSIDNTFVPRPETRPITKYEKRGQRLGHGVWDLFYTCSDPFCGT